MESCPGYDPDASPRKAVTDDLALVANKHAPRTTVSWASDLEVSTEVTLEVPLQETCQGAEVETEGAEGERLAMGGGVHPGEAVEAIEENPVTDAREAHKEGTTVPLPVGVAETVIDGIQMWPGMIAQRSLEGDSPK